MPEPAAATRATRKTSSRRGEIVTSDRRASGFDMTMHGQVQGTPAYMSPEQAQGSKQLDEGTDIFALGGVLYTMLTNKLPVDGKSEDDVLVAALEDRVVPPRRRAPRANVPAELEAVAMTAMARRRNDRFATVADLRADIERFLDGRRLGCVRYSPWQRAAKWVRRHPTLSISAAATGSLATVAALVVVTLLANLQAVEQQREIAAARTAQAEAIAKQEAADRARAEAESDAQTQRALLAETKAAIARGELDQVRDLVNSDSKATRDEIVQEFTAAWAERMRRGESESQFVVRIGTTRLQKFLAAYDRMIDEVAPVTGLQLTSNDFLHRGFIRMMLGHAEGALDDLNRAVELDPYSTAAMNCRGMIRLRTGDAKGAVVDFDRAIAFDPDAVGAYHNRAMARAQLGDVKGALDDYGHALRLNPNASETWGNRATLKSQTGDYVGAIADYDRAAALTPESALTYNNRGAAKLQAGDLVGALADFEMALKLLPNFADAVDNRGRVRYETGDVAGAMADFQRAQALNPQVPSTYINIAMVYHDQGEFSRAIAELDRALGIQPGNMSALYLRGVCKHRVDDFAGAVVDFDAVLTHDPRIWQCWQARAAALMRANRASDGIYSLQQAYRHCPVPHIRQQLAEQIRQAGGTVPE